MIYVSLHTCIKTYEMNSTSTTGVQIHKASLCWEELTLTMIIQIKADVWNLCELQILPVHHILPDVFMGLQRMLNKLGKNNKLVFISTE